MSKRATRGVHINVRKIKIAVTSISVLKIGSACVMDKIISEIGWFPQSKGGMLHKFNRPSNFGIFLTCSISRVENTLSEHYSFHKSCVSELICPFDFIDFRWLSCEHLDATAQYSPMPMVMMKFYLGMQNILAVNAVNRCVANSGHRPTEEISRYQSIAKILDLKPEMQNECNPLKLEIIFLQISFNIIHKVCKIIFLSNI